MPPKNAPSPLVRGFWFLSGVLALGWLLTRTGGFAVSSNGDRNHGRDKSPRTLSVQAYQQAVTVRNAELQVLWTRYNVQSALNLGVLVAVVGLPGDSPLSVLPGWTVLIVGLFLAGMWLWTAIHSGLWLRYWESEMIALEKQTADVYPLMSRAYAKPPSFTGTQHYVALLVPVMLIAVWLLLFFGGLLERPDSLPVPPRLESIPVVRPH